ncbi:MAG: GNAT family N-acetyltransferase [Pseudomonadota bacterium]|nr:GNAT family N-acetyltransferase [Pseudomonadota bacterium]
MVTDAPDPRPGEVIAAALGAFNTERGGPGEWRRLAVLIGDEAGAVAGGLWGKTSYGWLFTELLFVPAALRGGGLGTEILERAEAEARLRGCHSAWLDTFEFQARGFYERRGYSVFARLDDYPTGSARYFLKKRL